MNATDLIARYAARRDAEAFAALVRDYQAMVVATCWRRLAVPGDVDDAVQETFLKLAKNAGALRSNVAAWLHRCALNVASDLNRRGEARRRHESAAAVVDVSSDASRELAELREHLDAALDRLDEAQRELILQRFFVGRSQAELAAEANVSPSAMSQRVDRAIEALRGHLAAMGTVAAGATLATLLSAEHASAQVAPALAAKLNAIGLTGAPAAATAIVGVVWSAIGAACLLAIATAAIWWSTLPTTAMVAATTTTTRPDTSGGGLTVRPDANANASAAPDWRGPAATPGGVLAGRITDADGKPVAGATVALNNVRNAEVTTNADGVYRFDSIPRDGEYQLTVDATGFVPVDAVFADRDAIRLSANAQAVRNVVLERAHLVTVLVNDAAGVPIAEPNVSYIPAGSDVVGHRSQRYQRSAHRKRGEDEVVIALPVGPASYAIMATAKDYAPAFAVVAPTTAEASNVTITMIAGVSVDGTATCKDGKPAAGWQIAATPADWPTQWNYPIPFAKIDDAGHFTLTHVPPGKHVLTIQVGSSGTTLGTFDLTGAPIAVPIPMSSPGSLATIRGKLKWVGNATDNTVAYGMTIQAAGTVDQRYYSTMVQTDPKRRPTSFEIKDVEPGEYTIDFQSTTFMPVKLEHVKIPGELPEITLRAVQKSKLAGTVVDEQTGKPVTNFAFRVRKVRTLGDGPNYGQSDEWVQIANANGAFAADLVGPGEYQVQISAGGYAWRWSDVAKVETPGAMATTTVKLNAGGGLRGVVFAPDGKPVANAKVIPFSMAQSAEVQWDGTTTHFDGEAGAVLTDASGHYALDHVSAGDETLKIVHPNFVTLVTPPTRVVVDQVSDALPITLRIGASVSGIVYDATGQPQANVGIVFRDKPYFGENESVLLGSATTDAAGRYRVDHLPAQPIYATVDEHVQHGGIWRRAIRPRDGQAITLDLGGASTLTGRLVDGAGKPRAVRQLLFSNGDRIFAATLASAKPGADGRFTLRGMPAGRYTLYVEVENTSDDVAIRGVTIGDGAAATDLGDVVDDRGRVVATVTAEDPADAPKGVALTNDPAIVGHNLPIAMFRKEGDRWICDNAPAGRWIVSARGADYSDVGVTAIDRHAGEGERQVTIALPKRTATIRYVPSTQPTFAYAKLIDLDGNERLGLGGDQPATILVPPGTYRITAGNTQRPRADIAPIVVVAGESADVTLAAEHLPIMTDVSVWSADGMLVTDAKVTLVNAAGETIAPVPFIGAEHAEFPVPPGHYTARIERPGAAVVERSIDVTAPPHATWTSPVTCDVVLP